MKIAYNDIYLSAWSLCTTSEWKSSANSEVQTASTVVGVTKKTRTYGWSKNTAAQCYTFLFSTCDRQTCRYLKHETDHKHHCHTWHNVGMVLDQELMAEDWWILGALVPSGCHFQQLSQTGDVDTVAAGLGKEVAFAYWDRFMQKYGSGFGFEVSVGVRTLHNLEHQRL